MSMSNSNSNLKSKSLVTDIIKMKLVDMGYLKDIPYHLISDEEMCDAFINPDENVEEGYFFDAYPLLSNSSDVVNAYQNLVTVIRYYISELRNSNSDKYILPDWVLSYMLGKVISINSDYRDIHDLIKPLGVDNIDDIFTAEAQEACYNASKAWINKLESKTLIDSATDNPILGVNNQLLITRPITMFGEPHIIKYIRLNLVDPKL